MVSIRLPALAQIPHKTRTYPIPKIVQAVLLNLVLLIKVPLVIVVVLIVRRQVILIINPAIPKKVPVTIPSRR